jgi:hypothetical protein
VYDGIKIIRSGQTKKVSIAFGGETLVSGQLEHHENKVKMILSEMGCEDSNWRKRLHGW